MAISTEDKVELTNIMGQYCLRVDAGDPTWADLFVEDGVLEGLYPEPIVGREALRAVPRSAVEAFGGLMRHHLTSIAIEESPEGARFRAYNLVTHWGDGGKLLMNARYDLQAVRTAAGWRLKHVYAEVDGTNPATVTGGGH
jgi:hypothetical protein